MAGRVIHFEIHAANPERAMAFYTALFEWSFAQWGEQEYWLATTGDEKEPGINGALIKRRGGDPVEGQAVNAYVCTVGVADLDASLALVKKQGGTQVVEKMAVPGVGYLAYAKDTEGNLFGMMQDDPNAQ